MSDPGELKQMRTMAERLAREAGAVQKQRYETDLDIRTKGTSIDLVTEVDHACEKLIVDALEHERPEDAIRRRSSDVVSVIRPNGRRARVKYSVKYSIPQSDPLRLVHSIRRATRKENGKALEDELDRKMNLDRYLRWLAFNSLSENGDSRNELYLFEERTNDAQWGRLDLVAWDYDDVQERPIRAAEVLRDPLLYGCEMDLDFVIREDKQLYSRYKRVLRNLLEGLLTEEELIATLRNVRETLERIDSGLPEEMQLAARNDRTKRMLVFQERLLFRRRTLLALLDQP